MPRQTWVPGPAFVAVPLLAISALLSAAICLQPVAARPPEPS